MCKHPEGPGPGKENRMHKVDEERLQDELEIKSWQVKNGLVISALANDWKPDFQKAIEEWHTACLELNIGQGYVDHILEEHPEQDLIECILSVLESQAREFLGDEESKEPINPDDYRLLEIDTKLKWVVNSYPLSELELQRARLYKVHGDSVRPQHCELIIATPISLGMQGPADVPHYEVPEYDEHQVVGVQYDCEEKLKEAANTNANRWRKALGL